jgi:hypothetical protein
LPEQRTVVSFSTLKGLNLKLIQAERVSIYGIDALILQILSKWHNHFAQGRTELFDHPDLVNGLNLDLTPRGKLIGDLYNGNQKGQNETREKRLQICTCPWGVYVSFSTF